MGRSAKDIFLGREAALDVLTEHRTSGSGAVLTVVGTAGIGKTRLVREYLAALADDDDYETAIASLADLGADNAVDRVVASCGLIPTGSDDLARLCKRLLSREVETVLVIDNAEYVDAAPQIASRLASIDHVQVIVTSREPLGIPEERIYSLEPLSVVDSASLLQRIAGARGVLVDEADSRSLAEALGGLPLAICLAAERTTILSPAQIQSRVRESNRVLSGGEAGRHASLDLALSHSWAHLDEDERAVCIALSAFDHPVRADIAAHLLEPLDLQTLGPRLVARSWLVDLIDDDVHRLDMLSALKTFAREQSSTVERLEVRSRMALWALENLQHYDDWWIDRVREALSAVATLREEARHLDAARVLEKLYWGALHGKGTREILAQSAELVEVIDGGDASGEDLDVCARLCIGIAKIGLSFAYDYDWTAWASRGVALATTPATQVWALSQASITNLERGDRTAAEEAARRGLRLFVDENVEADPPIDAVRWLLNFAVVLHGIGDVEAALEALDRADGPARHNPRIAARCLCNRAFLLFDTARFEESAQVVKQAQSLVGGERDPEHILSFTVLPAYLKIFEGAYDAARDYLDAVERVATAHDNRMLHFYHHCALAELALAEGRSPVAILEAAKTNFAQVDGNSAAINEVCALLGLAEVWRGDHERAEKKLQSRLLSPEQLLPGDPTRVSQMVRAALRFAASRHHGRVVETDEENPFNAITSMALHFMESHSKPDVDALDEMLRRFDIATLMIPGFFMFRYEQHIRAWVIAEWTRTKIPVLRIERRGRIISLDDHREDLSNRGVLRHLLLRLARAAVEEAGSTVTVNELIEATWPGQAVHNKSMHHRAYANINRLRKLPGIGDLVERTANGYRLKMPLRIERIDG